MAETLGLRGPCTAPRRRCCPAWRWTATAWVRPRPDACPLRACRARCRLGSTWPASTSTRTRVSTLPCQSPLPPPDPRREAPEIHLGLFPGVRYGGAAPPSRPVHRGASSLGSRGGETPGPRAEAGREAPADRGALLRCLPWRGFSPVCGNWSHLGRMQPRAPAAEAGLEFSKSGPATSPTFFETCTPGARIYS